MKKEISSGYVPEFPYSWYNEPGDILEMWFEEQPSSYYKYINNSLSLMYSRNESGKDKLVGVQIWNFKKIVESRFDFKTNPKLNNYFRWEDEGKTLQIILNDCKVVSKFISCKENKNIIIKKNENGDYSGIDILNPKEIVKE